jgi:hypothetical protein
MRGDTQSRPDTKTARNYPPLGTVAAASWLAPGHLPAIQDCAGE